MVKKIVALLMALAMLAVTVTGCSKKGDVSSSSSETASTSSTAQGLQPIAKDKLKVGFVYIGKINDGGYNQSHAAGLKALQADGIQCEYKEDVKEKKSECLTAINELIDKGCNVIYTTSYGFGDATKEAAAEHPNIYFGYATGTASASNICTYMGRVEESRYLTGIVAGLKTKTNKIGYVAAFAIPECIRGINAFTLGVQSVNPKATVNVKFTNTWYGPDLETTAANTLLDSGCDVLAQHQDSTACQLAAQAKNAYAIGYNLASPTVAPKAYLTAALFNWKTFYVENVNSIINGTWKNTFSWEGLKADWVSIDNLSANCPAEAQAKVDKAKVDIESGTLKLFQGPVKDQTGAVKATDMTDTQIWEMNWFVQGVNGSVK